MRVLANPDWRSQSPEALVTYLPRLHSDHSPSPLGSLPSSTPIGLLEDLITGSKNMVERIKTWNRESFGNLFGRKKQLKARIHGLQCIPIHNRFHQLELLEAHLLAEYTKILIQEEIFWLQKSRVQWLQHGDRNSRFFHLSRTLDGSWNLNCPKIPTLDCHSLVMEVTKLEVNQALCMMKPRKACGMASEVPSLTWYAQLSKQDSSLLNLNVEKTEFFSPSRGLLQGDPISRYLFVLCMERLGHMIHTEVALIVKDLQQSGDIGKLAELRYQFRNCQKRSKRSQIRVGAMAADEWNVKIEKFDGTDFGFWKMQIEDFLYQKNLYQPLSGKQPEGMKNEDWVLLDRQALGVIRLTLSRNVAFNIAKEKTTTSLMATLSSMYEKPSTSNKVHLMRRLFNLQMEEGASVAQHLNELNTITTQLSSVEIEFNDEVRALILLPSLPYSWNATVTTVSSLSGNSKLKLDDVQDLRLSSTKEKYWRTGICQRDRGDRGIFPLHPMPRNHGELYSGDFRKVHLADDETLKIIEKGDIRLKLENQTTWKLKGVRHIPGLKRNLISVRQLDGEGYSTTFSGCEWKITKGVLVIAHGKKTGTLYITSNLENIIAAADADGKSNLWHQRLGHMSEKGMKTLLSKEKLSDLKNVDVGLCEDCIFGKQKKVSFAKIGKTPKEEKLELVHTDVWGPSPVPSLAGSLYYVTFIDDSTRKVSIYFLKKKSEVFDTFKKWKVMVENETGLKIKRLRTLNERARSMRIHDGLPIFLWAEAINTATYLINHGPSVPLDGRILEEVWSKKEINLSHLRVFGCISYVHIDSVERSKLDAKSKKCAFVGYGDDEFGYWFWDYENRKIIRSRDVIFNENVLYKDRATIESSSSNTKAETKEFAEFEEFSGNDVQINPEAVQEERRTPELRRSSIFPKPTQRYSPSLHYLLLTENGEPECYDEAMQVEDSVQWESSTKDEMDSLMSNQILVLKIVSAKNLHLEKLDVKTSFLHGDLEEEIYMRHPEGFIEAGKKNLVCRLKKSLYSLKHAPRQWYKKFDSFMSSSGFTRCQADHCCYIKKFDNIFIILLLYVDDMLVVGSDMQEIINLNQKLSKQFAMKDLGAAKQILGMRIKRGTKSGTLMLSQAEYINKVLSRFNMQDAKPVSTPLGVHFRLSKEQSTKTEEERAHMVKVLYASAIGSLIYVMVCIRPDIAQAVGAVSRDTILTGYVDVDLAGNVDIRRSTTGYVYTLGGTACRSSWSHTWKILVYGLESLAEGMLRRIEDGDDTLFWVDNWLGQPKCPWKLQTKLWDIQDTRPRTFTIGNILLIRSTYVSIVVGENRDLKDDYAWIWSLPVPSRWRTFIWLAWRDRLLTNECGGSWGMSHSASCTICGCPVENLSHILRDCDMARQIWSGQLVGIMQSGFFTKDVHSWLFDNLELKNNSQQWVILFATTIWRLWTTRCRRIFEPDEPAQPEYIIWRNMVETAKEVLSVNVKRRLDADSKGISFPRGFTVT
ncbi:hypothetical protein F3Y22_tig00110429pilonHSYRG00830 [Hibiscus syriacus]|uniref:Retrovirus-related Pol polyprotein from transposon TNT 1-94 n=1 Tax=Hibiscus syriacus TaxID=106335 RepID=A0A6A3APS3_HIBSY|nr:hypothetical protein F3Y22_tig00110429pilonHSYRG00830 [Hibiscus syriacus]